MVFEDDICLLCICMDVYRYVTRISQVVLQLLRWHSVNIPETGCIRAVSKLIKNGSKFPKIFFFSYFIHTSKTISQINTNCLNVRRAVNLILLSNNITFDKNTRFTALRKFKHLTDWLFKSKIRKCTTNSEFILSVYVN